MAKLVDVARLAGVSISTVSHVVNNTRTVKEETRNRILAALEETGYTPDPVARALRRAATDSLGVEVSDITNPFFTEVVRGIQDEARAAGFTILLGNSDDDPYRALETIQALQARRVDGLIVSPTAGPTDDLLARLRGLKIPVVLIDRLTPSGFDQVGVENEAPVQELVAHLVALGHRRIGAVTGIPGISTTEERIRGYRRALERSGVPYDPALVVTGNSQARPAGEAVRLLMALDHPPTAILTGNNMMTLGALRALRDLGIKVPLDVALVAFDDFEWADLFYPGLTTIAQPAYQVGREAVRLLIRRLRDKDARPRTVRLRPTLVHRQSCGCRSVGPVIGDEGTLQDRSPTTPVLEGV